MKLIICLFICCVFGNAHTKSRNVGTDERFDALFIRIDQLEARDRIHQTEIEKLRHDHETEIAMLRNEHNTEIGKLRHAQQEDLDELRQDMARQTLRIAELEDRAQRQGGESTEFVNTPDGASTSEEQDGRDGVSMEVTENTETSRQRRSTIHREQSAISRNRVRRYENDVDVAFYATLTAHAHHIGTNQIIAFDHVVTNIGNSYNPHVGVFVAPVTGIYVFSVTLTTLGRDRAHYGIFRNLEQITVLFVNGEENYADVTSQTAVLHLAKGDDVTIKLTESDHGLTGYNHSMFSGFLLSQDFTDSSPIVGK